MYDNQWWTELRHGGVLISPTVLQERLPKGPESIKDRSYEGLRDAYTRYLSVQSKKNDDDRGNLNAWLNEVLETHLGFPKEWWLRGNDIPDSCKVRGIGRERIRPDRVLTRGGDKSKPLLLLRIDPRGRIGSGKGRNEFSKLIELMRGTKVDFGIITNGEQFRLVHAGLEHESWTEWEVSRWFEDSMGKRQLEGLKALCGRDMMVGPKGRIPLREWVKESRNKQGELSVVLGEQTRRAVETLLDSLDLSIKNQPELKDFFDDLNLTDEKRLEAMYQATIRIVMRLVVIFYAESRGLLDKDGEIYFSSYGAEGLFRQLSSAVREEGEEALESWNHSWPRLLALFRLIHEGCSEPDIQIIKYGGELFAKGNPESKDATIRAIALFEDDRVKINDSSVYSILKLLRIGKLKVKEGRTYRWVSGPVDFSDLRTEYIGMMYEGLLDYRLREVTSEEEAVVFLNIGDQPALPLSLLKSMTDSRLKSLLQDLGKIKDYSEDEDAEMEGEVAIENLIEDSYKENETGVTDGAVHLWAKHAIKVLGKVKRGKTINEYEYQKRVDREAENLVVDYKNVGQIYLVRSSGTRKGSGTFYTRPQLAVPTVIKTLGPLLYENGENRQFPKSPEDILSVNVCDPAMGSGSFLVAALNEITEALYRSLWEHERFRETDCETTIILPAGNNSKAKFCEDLVKFRSDEDSFETVTKSRLKRYVVERCIYGVDINPLAVELAKLSLWIETLDRELPFGFLDHKLKCGNSLVGCWYDLFSEYPLMAWKRDYGDKDFDGKWTKDSKSIYNDIVKSEFVKKETGQTSIIDWSLIDEKKARDTIIQSANQHTRMHDFPMFGDGFEAREEFYKKVVMQNSSYLEIKKRFDLWCSVWFWPGDWLDEDCPTPDNFFLPSTELLERSDIITKINQFFHWELEFPDVFVTGKGGFDAVVGNPPWETLQPVSKEFFTNYDPIFRTYSKQEALSSMKELFQKNPIIKHDWVEYLSYYKSMSNWGLYAADPLATKVENESDFNVLKGKEKNILLQNIRRRISNRASYADKEHPFQHQYKGKPYTYKMFVELSHALVNNNGRVGLIIPSGIYSDFGTKSLRELLIERCRWEWLFCFENRKKIFDIHSMFKFGPIIFEKGKKTDRIMSAFMRQELADWEEPERFVINYDKDLIKKFSPKTKTILELKSEKDLEILSKIYSNSVLLGDQGPDGWKIQYAQGDFNMTSDSNLFPPRSWWENKGYSVDPYGRWMPPENEKPELIFKGKRIGPDGDIGLPLYQGVMIWQFDFSNKGYVSGAGNRAVWSIIDWSGKKISPQFIIPSSQFKTEENTSLCRLVFRDISNSTNERTMVSSLIPYFPTGNATPILNPKNSIFLTILLQAILGSIIYDFSLRTRVGGTHLNYYIIEESPLIKIENYYILYEIVKMVFKLNCPNPVFAHLWLIFKKDKDQDWRKAWAVSRYERLRIRCILDALISYLYGLNFSDLSYILKIDKKDPQGFWRVDGSQPIELRQTTLTLYAYKNLLEMGVSDYLNQNDGEGWMIPEKIRISINIDGILEFDESEAIEYEVASKLGPRFVNWQTESAYEESWNECEKHAHKILGDVGFEKFIRNFDIDAHENFNEDGVRDRRREIVKFLDSAFSKQQRTIDNKKRQRDLYDFGGDEE